MTIKNLDCPFFINYRTVWSGLVIVIIKVIFMNVIVIVIVVVIDCPHLFSSDQRRQDFPAGSGPPPHSSFPHILACKYCQYSTAYSVQCVQCLQYIQCTVYSVQWVQWDIFHYNPHPLSGHLEVRQFTTFLSLRVVELHLFADSKRFQAAHYEDTLRVVQLYRAGCL